MTFDDILSIDLTLTRSRLAAGMDDGIAEDRDTQNGLKQAVGGTISEKRTFCGFDVSDGQN
jgi:hypothetical protein